MLYRLSTFLTFCFLKIFYKLEVEGKTAIPKQGPFILASNHLSNFDPPVLATVCPRKLGFLAKEELFEKNIPNLYFRSVGAMPLKRGQSDIRAMRLVLKTLERKPLLIFPQGRRKASLEVANNGVGFLCKKAAVPVVAARIYGTDQKSFRGVNLFKRGRIRVIFAAVDDIAEDDSREDITQKVMAGIKNLG
jgi:1-acyl-sn-glycerol-3-phosphate acyltransferase